MAVQAQLLGVEIEDVRQQMTMRVLHIARGALDDETARELADVIDAAIAAVSISAMAELVPGLFDAIINRYELAVSSLKRGVQRDRLSVVVEALVRARASAVGVGSIFDGAASRLVCELALALLATGVSGATSAETMLADIAMRDLTDTELFNAVREALTISGADRHA